MKANKKYIFLIFIPMFICAMIFRCMYIPIDSDYSNLVLEANDILQGDIFLKDWNQTGISFLTTDLLFFIFGSLFGGVSTLSYHIAIGLMISLAILLGLALCEPSKRSCIDNILYILLSSIPCYFAMLGLRAHTGAVCWVFVSFFFINREVKKHSTKNLIFIFLFLTMGCIGDAITLIIGVFPVIVYGLGVLFSQKREERQSKKIKWLLGVTVAAVICGTILDKLYYYIGGANKNEFLGEKVFEPLENWGPKFVIYLRAIFLIEDASFYGNNLLSIRTLCYFVNTVIIIIGFILIIKTLWEFIKGKEKDLVSVLLSLGFLVISVLFVITNIAVDVWSSRYLAYVFVAFGVLIVRNQEWLCGCTRLSKQAVSVLLLLVALASFSFKILDIYRSDRALAEQAELVAFLEQNGLQSGYGGFWDASATTVSSKNQVKVRAIVNVGDDMKSDMGMYNWFCENNWYQEYANFVVTTDDSIFGVKADNVISCFGQPVEVLQYKNWEILVYDKDLSKILAQ